MILGAQVGAFLKQELDHGILTPLRCENQRSRASFILCLDPSSLFEGLLRQCDISVGGRLQKFAIEYGPIKSLWLAAAENCRYAKASPHKQGRMVQSH